MTVDSQLILWIAEKLGVEIAYADDGRGWQYVSEEHEGWCNFHPFTGDWMLKGMGELMQKQMGFRVNPRSVTVWDRGDNEYCVHHVNTVSIPRAFWECWYKAEVEKEKEPNDRP